MVFDEVDVMGLYRHPDRLMKSIIDGMDPKPEEPGWEQLEIRFNNDPEHIHKWYDNDGEQGLGFYCECGAFSEVSFRDPWEGKTNQEVYEMMQKDKRYK